MVEMFWPSTETRYNNDLKTYEYYDVTAYRYSPFYTGGSYIGGKDDAIKAATGYIDMPYNEFIEFLAQHHIDIVDVPIRKQTRGFNQ